VAAGGWPAPGSAQGGGQAVISDILPPGVMAEETFTDVPGPVLFAAEEAVLARVVDKRRREFTTGRACARAALARLGVPPAPILPGARGAPQWPAGIVGSITHCDGYRAAAVAWAHDVTALGLDAEPNEPLPGGVLAVIASEAEVARLTTLDVAHPATEPAVPATRFAIPAALAPTSAGVCWDRLLFCAKEAVYKAWYPLTGRWLGFEQADVTIAPAAGTFTARLLAPATGPDGSALTSFTGRWLARDGLILTTVVLLPPR
jgi:4'-phosphopantetheinyl transferase EntD